jgi:hypothetical protein
MRPTKRDIENRQKVNGAVMMAKLEVRLGNDDAAAKKLTDCYRMVWPQTYRVTAVHQGESVAILESAASRLDLYIDKSGL